jgi:hypothetical protein
MQHKLLDTFTGCICGIIGGGWKYLSQIPFEKDFGIRLFEASITAFLCGLLGVAGKHLFTYMLKKITAHFKK